MTQIATNQQDKTNSPDFTFSVWGIAILYGIGPFVLVFPIPPGRSLTHEHERWLDSVEADEDPPFFGISLQNRCHYPELGDPETPNHAPTPRTPD